MKIQNGRWVNDQGDKLTDIDWKEFKSLGDKITSLFGTDITYEWIRQNLSYKTLVTNYLKLRTQFKCSTLAVVQAHNLLNIKKLTSSFKDISIHPLTHPPLLAIRNAPRWAIEQAIEDTKDNLELQNVLKLNLTAGPTHDLALLESHTHYLNAHRTHYFNPNEWKVQIRT